MATYRKEKNLIYIQTEGSSGHYTLDLNTGIFLGVKGTAIKTNPKKSECSRCFPRYNDGSTNLTYTLSCMFDHCSRPSEYARYVKALGVAEKLDALNIPNCTISIRNLEMLESEIKGVAAYIKTLDNLSNFRVYDYLQYARYEKMKKRLGSALEGVPEDMVSALLDRMPEITDEDFTTCLYYLVRGKMWAYHGGIPSQLIQYLDYCRIMEKKPERVNNFMREYIETRDYYNRKKAEYDDIRLNQNYTKHKAAWEFSYGNYTVIVPTKGQDIVEEGQKMHHCVGGYVNSVVEGNDYIVFIRHKDTPDVPYITCEVYTDGRIGQYYLAYDRRISNAEDLAFRNAFADHLARMWG